MPNIDLSILNQRQTPAFYADVFANRPAAGFVGRIFVSTDTYAFYRDNGTGWDLIGGPGTGTVTGTGANGQVTFWNGASTITGSNDLFWDATNGHLGVNTNAPGTALDVHHDQPTVAILNQTVATNDVRIGFQNNGVGLWRIGAFYNAGANDFGIYDAVAAIQPVTVKKTSGQVLIGTSTVGSGKLVVASASSDNGIQIVGASAPSLRIDSAESGPTKRAGLGISTATNNFIQGSADRDFCIFNGSTAAASPILFGIYDAGAVNVQEAARISPARNFLVGTTTDAGYKLAVNGTSQINGELTLSAGLLSLSGSAGNPPTSGVGLRYVSNRLIIYGGSADITFQKNNNTGSNMVILDSGNVGIGTTSPATTLEVLGVNEGEYFRAGGGTISGRSLTFSSFTVSGTVGVGHRISAPNASASLIFNVAGIDSLSISNTGDATFSSNINVPTNKSFQWNDGSILNSSSGQIRFYTGGSSILAATISSSQNLLIGTTTDAGQKLQVNGNALFGTSSTGQIIIDNLNNSPSIRINGGSGSGTVGASAYFRLGDNTNSRFWIQQINNSYNYAYWFFDGGTWTNVSYLDKTTGAYVALSDRNKKKNFENSNIGLDAVLKLKPTLYNMSSQKDEEDKQLGFIAQEVKDIIPQAYQESGDFIGLNYQPIVATLVKAIQELNTKIENLK